MSHIPKFDFSAVPRFPISKFQLGLSNSPFWFPSFCFRGVFCQLQGPRCHILENISQWANQPTLEPRYIFREIPNQYHRLQGPHPCSPSLCFLNPHTAGYKEPTLTSQWETTCPGEQPPPRTGVLFPVGPKPGRGTRSGR